MVKRALTEAEIEVELAHIFIDSEDEINSDDTGKNPDYVEDD